MATATELTVHFDGVSPSQAVEDRVREHVEKLNVLSPNLISCRTTIIADHKHTNKALVYRVNIDAHLPGTNIVVSHERGQDHSHEDVYAAVRDAFASAKRQLIDHNGKQKASRVTHHNVEIESDGLADVDTTESATS